MTRSVLRFGSRIAGGVAPTYWKEFHELKYWKKISRTEGSLANSHFKYFYTSHFGLTDGDYAGKFVADIGCGPRGTLEWATMASRRVGVDPLANEYLKLGASRHKMEYINAPSENIPLEDAACDILCSFNSLDHVQDVSRTLAEVKRLVRPGGLFLLLVEVNHPPTACEPHELSPSKLIELVKPEFVCEGLDVYKRAATGIYDSIQADQKVSNPETDVDVGYMSSRFRRTVL
jgi:SAM-dependent methyltransferase